MNPITKQFTLKVCKDLERSADLIEGDFINLSKDPDPIEYIRHFVDIRDVYDHLKEATEAIQKMKDRLSSQYIPDLFRANQIKTINIEDIGRVTVSYRFSCSMLDKEQGLTWLRGNNLGGIIQETVNSSTLAATAKSRLEEENKDMPEDIFKTSSMPYTSITKAR